MNNITPQNTPVVAIFHKNIYSIFQHYWVEQCLQSIFNQTHKQYKVYEINYGTDNLQLWPGSIYEQKPLDNHAQAQNYLFTKIFTNEKNAIIFNTNLDDVYYQKRIEIQLQAMQQGYDLVSSNFQICSEDLSPISITEFHNKDIVEEQQKNHNIICHPVIAITEKFWKEQGPYYESDYHKSRDEDFGLWKRATKNNANMIILPDVLCQYRVHANQTGKITNKR